MNKGWKPATSRRRTLKLATGVATISTIGSVNATAQDSQQNTPTEIEDWYDLDGVRDDLDGDYILVNQLDETTAGYGDVAGSDANSGDGFKPIGDSDNPFTGNFNGNIKNISNVVIDRQDETKVGLFGVTDQALLRNIRVINADITGKDEVGTVVGENSGSEITNVHAGGKATGNNQSDAEFAFAIVGGLVGTNIGEVSNSTAVSGVSADGKFTNAGGLVGANRPDGTVSDSYATGDVTSSSGDVGGLVGANRGEVNSSYATGNVTGPQFVGGLVGQNRMGTITKSYATGTVTGNDSSTLAGGLVGGQGGITNDGNAKIIDSYATGDVDGVTRVGGLIGSNRSTDSGEEDGVIERSFAVGQVSGESAVGGFAGKNDGSFSDSYWDTQTNGQNTAVGDGSDNGIKGLTTAEMKGQTASSNMAGFAFDQTWEVVTDPAGYPKLQAIEGDSGNQSEVQIVNSTLNPSKVSAESQSRHELEIEVENISADGGGDSFTISLPDAVDLIEVHGVSVANIRIDGTNEISYSENKSESTITFTANPDRSVNDVRLQLVVDTTLAGSDSAADG